MKDLIEKFKAIAWDDKIKWILVGIIALIVIDYIFVGDAEANVNPDSDIYKMDPKQLPQVQPFEMRWPDVDYYFSCYPMNPQGIYACRFIPNGQ